MECIANANQNPQNFCRCNWDWSGEKCNVYIGPCPDVCNGCTGNSDFACIECIDNAELMIDYTLPTTDANYNAG
jgi:hypothetical protein